MSVVIRSRSRWLVLGVLVALGVYALVHYDLRAGGDVLTALGLSTILVSFGMRVAADDSGVTIVNLAWPVRIPCGEIDGFQMRSRNYSSYCLEVRTRHRRRISGWVCLSLPRRKSYGARRRPLRSGPNRPRRSPAFRAAPLAVGYAIPGEKTSGARRRGRPALARRPR